MFRNKKHLDLKERVGQGGVSILDIGQSITDHNANVFEERVLDLMADGQRRILLNFGSVKKVEALDVMQRIQKVAQLNSTRVTSYNFHKRMDVATSTRLAQMFGYYETEKEALASFQHAVRPA